MTPVPQNIVTIDPGKNIKGAYVRGHADATEYLKSLPQSVRASPTKQYPLAVFDDKGMTGVPIVGTGPGQSWAEVDAYCAKFKPNAMYRVNFLELSHSP